MSNFVYELPKVGSAIIVSVYTGKSYWTSVRAKIKESVEAQHSMEGGAVSTSHTFVAKVDRKYRNFGKSWIVVRYEPVATSSKGLDQQNVGYLVKAS